MKLVCKEIIADEYHKMGMTSYRNALIKSITDGKFLKENDEK